MWKKKCEECGGCVSWWGSHPKISKEDARKLITGAGYHYCRHCVYWTRVKLDPSGPCPFCCSGMDNEHSRVRAMYGTKGWNERYAPKEAA